MKTCYDCGERKPLKEFFRCSANRKDGRQHYCADCSKARTKINQQENPKAWTRYAMKWYWGHAEKYNRKRRENWKKYGTQARPSV